MSSGNSQRVPDGDRARVLLVEECGEDRQYYSGVLKGNGCFVRASGSYAEGVNWLDSEVFDIIMVGQGTPQFEGRLVLEHAKSLDRRLPVVVLAHSLDMNCYLEAMQLGAEDYLAGPMPASEVAAAVKRYVRPHGCTGSVVAASA
jgi:DNA-binding NtrC family response regulator